MDDNIRPAIDTLLIQLKEQEREVAETKNVINVLLRRTGQEPMFPDTEPGSARKATRPDMYYGRPLATVAAEFLERLGHAANADEILAGLESGGFDIEQMGWKDTTKLRNFSISLAKNTKTFHRLKNGTFGLAQWYPSARKASGVQPETDEKSVEATEEKTDAN